MRLGGKVAIVTGAAQGIGASITEKFIEEGAAVMMMDIKPKLKISISDTVSIIKGDVSKPEDCERVVKDTLKKFGKVHILINNAAVSFPGAIHSENSIEIWHKTLNTNLNGVFYMTKSVLKTMMKSNESSSIINLSSIGSQVVNPVIHPSYAASKGGIISLTKVMAPIYSKYNIRINAICPGGVKTPLWFSAPKDVLKRYEELHPLGSGEPEDIAWLCVYLASNESKWITGSIITADGGNLCAGGLAQEAKDAW